MQFDFLEIILLLGAGQGILLATAFLFSPDDKKRSSKVFFAFILLITSWQLIVYTLSISRNIVQVPHLLLSNRPFMFLIGPLYFFYVKSLTVERLEFKLWVVLHLIPFIFVFRVFGFIPKISYLIYFPLHHISLCPNLLFF